MSDIPGDIGLPTAQNNTSGTTSSWATAKNKERQLTTKKTKMALRDGGRLKRTKQDSLGL